MPSTVCTHCVKIKSRLEKQVVHDVHNRQWLSGAVISPMVHTAHHCQCERVDKVNLLNGRSISCFRNALRDYCANRRIGCSENFPTERIPQRFLRRNHDVEGTTVTELFRYVYLWQLLPSTEYRSDIPERWWEAPTPWEVDFLCRIKRKAFDIFILHRPEATEKGPFL